jgi:hypothetical protein
MTSSMLEKDIDDLHRPRSDVLLSGNATTQQQQQHHAKGGDVEMSPLDSHKQELDDTMNTALSSPGDSSSRNENHTTGVSGGDENGGDQEMPDANSEWVTPPAAPTTTTPDGAAKETGLRRRDICIATLLVLGMIVITTISVAVAVKNHNESSKEQSALPEELVGRVQYDAVTKEWVSTYVLPTRPIPTTVTDQEELDLVIATLTSNPLLSSKLPDLPKTVTELAALQTVTDPYILGAKWLTTTDTYNGKEDVINRYALAVFYYSLSGDKWINRTHWLSPTEYYCNWYGVVCCNDDIRTSTLCNSNEFGKIIEIDLFRNNLIGPIPDVISLFNPSLYSLYLSENSITGTIPGAAIATLSQFGTLNVAYNFLTGTIPVELKTNGIFSKYNICRWLSDQTTV